MKPTRAITRSCRFLTRSRVLWLILSALVIADTAWWASDLEPPGLVPAAVRVVLPTGGRRIVCRQPTPEILVLPPDASGVRRFLDAEILEGDAVVDAWSKAEYIVMGFEHRFTRGLWAPCARYDRARLRAIEIGPVAPAPQFLADEAFEWFAAQTWDDPEEARWAAATIARFRAGDRRTILWTGMLHDAAMLPLALLWLAITPSHTNRLLASISPHARRRSRRKRGLCEACAYDLSGRAQDRCPECGTFVSPEPSRPPRHAHPHSDCRVN